MLGSQLVSLQFIIDMPVTTSYNLLQGVRNPFHDHGTTHSLEDHATPHSLEDGTSVTYSIQCHGSILLLFLKHAMTLHRATVAYSTEETLTK
jgi:hypothetical protein